MFDFFTGWELVWRVFMTVFTFVMAGFMVLFGILINEWTERWFITLALWILGFPLVVTIFILGVGTIWR